MASWIFLRGLTRETAHWGRFPADFQRALPDSRVIALDLPGNGQLHQVASPLAIEKMVADCRSELERRGHKPPYCLLAMSLGAMVAAEWSCSAPQEVACCVLINTSLRPFSPFYRRLQPRNYLPLLGLALRSGTSRQVEQTILQLTSNAAEAREGVLADWVAARLQHPVRAANALRQLLAAARYRARREPPATAVLLLASEQDRLVHVDCSRAIAASWHCPLALHPSAGHDLPLDDPQWVIDQVRQWLASRSRLSGMDMKV